MAGFDQIHGGAGLGNGLIATTVWFRRLRDNS
jgi:hypothetical protein